MRLGHPFSDSTVWSGVDSKINLNWLEIVALLSLLFGIRFFLNDDPSGDSCLSLSFSFNICIHVLSKSDFGRFVDF